MPQLRHSHHLIPNREYKTSRFTADFTDFRCPFFGISGNFHNPSSHRYPHIPTKDAAFFPLFFPHSLRKQMVGTTSTPHNTQKNAPVQTATDGVYKRIRLKITANSFIIKGEIFVGIPHTCQISLEIIAVNHHRTPTIVGVEREHFRMPKIVIKKKMHVMFGIIDESERRDTSGFQPQILHHSLRRRKGKFTTRRQSACQK